MLNNMNVFMHLNSVVWFHTLALKIHLYCDNVLLLLLFNLWFPISCFYNWIFYRDAAITQTQFSGIVRYETAKIQTVSKNE